MIASECGVDGVPGGVDQQRVGHGCDGGHDGHTDGALPPGFLPLGGAKDVLSIQQETDHEGDHDHEDHVAGCHSSGRLMSGWLFGLGAGRHVRTGSR